MLFGHSELAAVCSSWNRHNCLRHFWETHSTVK